MKRKEFIECMQIHKYKKCNSNLASENYIKNEIDITWKIKNFKSKKSPANVGTVSVKIADGKDFNITNINDIYVLEGIIREAQNAIRTAPDFGAFGVG